MSRMAYSHVVIVSRMFEAAIYISSLQNHAELSQIVNVNPRSLSCYCALNVCESGQQ